MSLSPTGSFRRHNDHFEPERSLDPQEQRKLRGHLEQIDYMAYASNQAVMPQVLGRTDINRFQQLAVSAAQARAQWVKQALEVTEGGHVPTPEQTSRLAHLRSTFNELSQAYDAMRRMVERGYLPYFRTDLK